MTREEQIEQQAISEQRELMESYDWRGGFESGARWADKHPIEGLVSTNKVCNILDKILINTEESFPTMPNLKYVQVNFEDKSKVIDYIKKAMEE